MSLTMFFAATKCPISAISLLLGQCGLTSSHLCSPPCTLHNLYTCDTVGTFYFLTYHFRQVLFVFQCLFQFLGQERRVVRRLQCSCQEAMPWVYKTSEMCGKGRTERTTIIPSVVYIIVPCLYALVLTLLIMYTEVATLHRSNSLKVYRVQQSQPTCASLHQWSFPTYVHVAQGD